MKAKTMAVVAIMMLSAVLAVAIMPTSDSDGFTVTDYYGNEVEIDAVPGHVATLGYAFTKIAIDLGMKDRIILSDTTTQKTIADLPGYIGMYGSKDWSDVALALDSIESWDKENDLVITYGYASFVDKVKTLQNAGYKVICLYPKTYAEVVDTVSIMAKIFGCSDELAGKMTSTLNDVTSKATGLDKVEAVYVSGSSAKLAIGNIGIATEMIGIVGGVNVGANSSSTASSYEPAEGVGAFLQNKIDEGLTVILLDGNYLGTAQDFIDETLIKGDVTVYKMDKDWNSYVPDIADGLSYISKCIHPEVFGQAEGGVSASEPVADSDDNTMIYVVVIVVVVIIALVAVFLVKRSR